MKLAASMRISRAPMAALAMVGLFWGAYAALVPDIKAIAGASDGEFGLLMMLSAAGSMVSMYLAPRYFVRLGRWALPVAGCLLYAAFHYPIFGTDLLLLGIALLFMGATVGLLDISSNLRVAALESKHDASLMNVNHAMFSFAFGVAAILTSVGRQAGFGPAEILPVLAFIGLVFVALSFERAEAWEIETAAQEAPQPVPDGQIKKVIVLTAIVLFCGFIGENSTEAWSALHIERTLGAEVGHGSLGPGVLGIVMGFGRLFGQKAVDRLGERSLIVWSAVVATFGAVLIAIAWSPNIVLVGVAIVALGMAIVVPSVNTVLGRRVPEHARAVALSRAWMIGMTGFFLGPAIMGLVAEGFGLRIAYLFMALIVAAIVPVIITLGRIPLVHAKTDRTT